MSALVSEGGALYASSPLSEVVQEFGFSSPLQSTHDEWIAYLTEELAREFPNVTEGTIRVIGVDTAGDEPEQTKASWTFTGDGEGMVVTVTHDSFVVSVRPKNMQGSYPGWKVIHHTAIRLLNLYRVATGREDASHAVVRYLNALSVNPIVFRPRDVISAACNLFPASILDESNPFLTLLQHTLGVTDTHVHIERLRLFTGADESGQAICGLHIDEVVYAAPHQPVLRDLTGVCEQLHIAAHRVFASAFNETALEGFEPVRRSVDY